MLTLVLPATFAALATLSGLLQVVSGNQDSAIAHHRSFPQQLNENTSPGTRGILGHTNHVETVTVITPAAHTPIVHLESRSTGDEEHDEDGLTKEERAIIASTLALFLGVPPASFGTWTVKVITQYGWPFETIANFLKIEPWSHPGGEAPPRLLQQFESVYDKLLKVRYGLRDFYPTVRTYLENLGPKTTTRLLNLVNKYAAEGSEVTLDSSEASGVDTIPDSPASEGGETEGSQANEGSGGSAGQEGNAGNEGSGGEANSGGEGGSSSPPPPESPYYPPAPPPTGDNPWTSTNPDRLPRLRLPEPAKPLEPITPNGDVNPHPDGPGSESSNGSDSGEGASDGGSIPASGLSPADMSGVQPAPRPMITMIRHIKADGSEYLERALEGYKPPPKHTITLTTHVNADGSRIATPAPEPDSISFDAPPPKAPKAKPNNVFHAPPKQPDTQIVHSRYEGCIFEHDPHSKKEFKKAHRKCKKFCKRYWNGTTVEVLCDHIDFPRLHF